MAKTYKLGAGRRIVNAIVTPLLRIGIGVKSTYLLTTTGRKIGEKRTTPVILVESDTDRWLVSPYGAVAWVLNVRASPGRPRRMSAFGWLQRRWAQGGTWRVGTRR